METSYCRDGDFAVTGTSDPHLHSIYLVLPQEGSSLTLHRLVVDTVMFSLPSVMYRSVLFQQKDSSLLAQLLPELVSLSTIVCAWYGETAIGFLCMSFGTLLISLAVVWDSVCALCSEQLRTSVLGMLMNIGLPCLIFAQYHISFMNGSDMKGLSPAVVQCAVASFLLGTLMYRKVLDERDIDSTSLHLIPEVVAVGTVLLTAHGEAVYGLYFLVLNLLWPWLLPPLAWTRSLAAENLNKMTVPSP